MTNKKQAIEQKLSFLYQKLNELDEEMINNDQIRFLLEKIDQNKAELLEIEVEEYCSPMDNDAQ